MLIQGGIMEAMCGDCNLEHAFCLNILSANSNDKKQILIKIPFFHKKTIILFLRYAQNKERFKKISSIAFEFIDLLDKKSIIFSNIPQRGL